MDTALGLLLTLPAARTLILAFSNGLGGVPVTNTLVSTVEKLVVRNIVLLDVLLNLRERPVGHGVDLDKAGFVDFDDIEVATLATLAAATSSEDCVDVHFTVGTLSRLNLGNPVVKLVIDFPELGAVLGFEFGSGVDASRLVDVHVVVGILAAHTVDQGLGLIKVVEGVEEDEVNHLRARDLELRQHIQGNQTSQAKGSSLEEMRE